MNKNLQRLSNSNSDPATLGWPATLPFEIALRTASIREIRATYEIDDVEWAALKNNEQFRQAVLKCQEDAKEEGFSFKTKAKMQAEELLQTSWSLIHNEDTPAAVKADLIKFTTRIAGYEPNLKTSAEAPGAGFQININMGGASTPSGRPTVSATATYNPIAALRAESGETAEYLGEYGEFDDA